MTASNQSSNSTTSRFPYLSEGEFYAAMYKEVANSRYLFSVTADEKHDLVMGVLERAWKRRRSFDPEKGKLITWMNKVTSSFICDQIKANSRYEPLSDNDDRGKYGVDTTDSSKRKEKQLKALQKELSGLSIADQKLMKLYEGGCSGKEIAELLNISESNVRARISRIKSRLREKEEIIICCDQKCPNFCMFASDSDGMGIIKGKVHRISVKQIMKMSFKPSKLHGELANI